MDPTLAFLISWLVMCGGIALIIVVAVNYDRLAVLFLTLIDAPVYEEARRLAFLLIAHPEQWTSTTYNMSHPKVGEISGICVRSLRITGNGYGEWSPTAIERRIIWNAVARYRRVYIRNLLMRALD